MKLSNRLMNILTFNPEDWYNGWVSPQDTDWGRFEYRVDKMILPILEVLDEYHIKATFFCMGWLGEHHPDIIKCIASKGHHIGCNSYMHKEPNALKEEAFFEDLKKSKAILEDVTGKEVNAYRAPNFAIEGIEKWYFDVLCELGFKYDSSVLGEKPYLKGEIKEFPVSKYKGKIPYSGGGYFRLMPYALIKRWMKSSDYVMTYFHPRDFDKEQPRWEGLSVKENFLGYVGLNGAYDKWLSLIRDFSFVNIEEADKIIDWQTYGSV